MADNVTINGVTYAADDIGAGVLAQRTKVFWGVDGSAVDASATNPFPVTVISLAMPATFYHGQKTVTTAGTEVVLAASQVLVSGVTVKAMSTNTGKIYVGGNPVTSATGFELSVGESVFIATDNLADVWIDSSINAQSVSYLAS